MDPVVHFEIHADEPDRALDFYSRAFGWSVARMGDDDYWLATTSDGQRTGINGALIRRRGPRPAIGAPVVGAVITVQVDDLDATIERVCKLGADVALARSAIPGVGAVAYIHDTEANVIGVFQPLPRGAGSSSDATS